MSKQTYEIRRITERLTAQDRVAINTAKRVASEAWNGMDAETAANYAVYQWGLAHEDLEVPDLYLATFANQYRQLQAERGNRYGS